MSARLYTPSPVSAGNRNSSRRVLSRRGKGSSGSTGSRRPRRHPQFPQPKPPQPQPETPFQPGAAPAPPLGLYVAIGVGAAALVAWLWELFNQRPAPGAAELQAEQRAQAYASGYGYFVVEWKQQTITTNNRYCPLDRSDPDVTNAESGWIGSFVQGAGAELTTPSVSNSVRCGAGAPVASAAVPMIQTYFHTGERFPVLVNNTGGVAYTGGFAGDTAFKITAMRVRIGDTVIQTLEPVAEAGEEVLPRYQASLLPVPDAAFFAAPASAAGADLAPLDVPGSAPVPVPAADQVGLPSVVSASSPSPLAIPAGAPAVAPVPAAPAPQKVPAIGPLPTPTATPIVPTPASAVVVAGEVIGGPGQAPAPNLQAMAQELGRLERKAELTLEGGATQVALNAVREMLQSLLERLLAITPGTTYSIQPPCGTKPEGGPLDPVEVIAPGGDTPEAAILNRLDALALLIDEHKQIRQPICKGKPTGSPVTVTALEVE